MDPITVGAVLLAVATGVSEALGGQLWAGVVSLVRRPLRGRKESTGELSAGRSGEAELAALRESPPDQAKAAALAEVLLARADGDPGFERALQEWWARAEPIRAKLGNVTNTISGGYQYGPVLQGRDFIGLTFGATPAPPAGPKDPDADLALAGVRRFEEAISAHQDAAAIFREIGDLARLLPAFRRQTTHAAPNAMKPAQV